MNKDNLLTLIRVAALSLNSDPYFTKTPLDKWLKQYAKRYKEFTPEDVDRAMNMKLIDIITYIETPEHGKIQNPTPRHSRAAQDPNGQKPKKRRKESKGAGKKDARKSKIR